MSVRAGSALITLLLLGLAPPTASAQEQQRRCYFGECSEDGPQPRPSDEDSPQSRVEHMRQLVRDLQRETARNMGDETSPQPPPFKYALPLPDFARTPRATRAP